MQSIPIKNVGESRLVDPFQRQYYYLRLSITDQCNFRCTYCLLMVINLKLTSQVS